MFNILEHIGDQLHTADRLSYERHRSVTYIIYHYFGRRKAIAEIQTHDHCIVVKSRINTVQRRIEYGDPDFFQQLNDIIQLIYDDFNRI